MCDETRIPFLVERALLRTLSNEDGGPTRAFHQGYQGRQALTSKKDCKMNHRKGALVSDQTVLLTLVAFFAVPAANLTI
jgi:hypothetical protein